MTVQDLINALEDQPKGCDVVALIWPDHATGRAEMLSVIGCAALMQGGDNRVVLRIGTSL